MKISNFIKEYDSCPICNDVLDCIMYFDLTHMISYKKIANLKDGCRFLQVAEKSASYQIASPHKTCADCSKMPQFFDIKDLFPLPEGLVKSKYQKKSGPQSYRGYGLYPGKACAFIKIECIRHDFSRFSTEFDIYSDNHDIEIYDEAFDITPNKTVINCYAENETIIRVSDYTKKTKLIPLNKWPLGDKTKLSEKFDKLLILL